MNPHPVQLLFLTSFSDYCFRAIPAIAQMADAFDLRLTLMHVFDPAQGGRKEAESKIRSFFPEADRYPVCERIATAGPLLPAVRRYAEAKPVNLIVAPASDPIGLPKFWERPIRARLMQELRIPVWTMGRGTRLDRLAQPVRNVACWMEFSSDETSHLAFAIDFARKLNAQLHLLTAMPEVHEGSLLLTDDQNWPWHPEGAMQELLRICAGLPVRPIVHVTRGDGRRTRNRLLRECGADVAFFTDHEPAWNQWLGMGMQRSNTAPCPTIYVDRNPSIPQWNLAPRSGSEAAGFDREPAVLSWKSGAARGKSTPAVLLPELGLK